MPPQSPPPRGCLGFLFPRNNATPPDTNAPGASLDLSADWPYVQRPLLSPAEASFYRVLQQAAGSDHLVFPKVNLADLLGVAPRTPKPHAWRAKINRKHADYVLARRDTLTAVAVVELDDASHATADAKQRDDVKNQALAAAGLPLIRIKARKSYAVNELQKQLARALPPITPVQS